MDGYELVRQLRADPGYRADSGDLLDRALSRAGSAVAGAHLRGFQRHHQALRTGSGSERRGSRSRADNPPRSAAPSAEEFDRDHLRLLTDKLSQKADDLRATNERLSALVDLGLQLGSELDLQRLIHSLLPCGAPESVGARYAVTGILDAGRTGFRVCTPAAWTPDSGPAWDRRILRLPPLTAGPGGGPLRSACKSGRRSGGDSVSLPHPPIHSWLGAPIASPTQVYGYRRPHRQDRSRRSSAAKTSAWRGILAAQVGRVYQNGSLYADVLSHAADLEREVAARALIGEVGAALTRCDTLREMLQLVRRGPGPAIWMPPSPVSGR